MTRIDPFQLRKMIPQEEFDYTLLSGILSQYSGVRQKIHELLQAGIVTRVKKGLYVFGPQYNQVPVCREVLANLIYGPSYISLEYALAFHGLIPERVDTVTSVTSKRNKDFVTPLGRFNYQHLALKKYASGIEQVWMDPAHPIFMATIEKALCDYVFLKKIPVLSDKKDALAFLEKDLRIDSENFSRFDINQLIRLNRLFSNQNINRIIEVLEQREMKK